MRYLLGIEKDRQGTIYLRDGHPDKWPPVFRQDDQPGNRDRRAAAKPRTGAICLPAAERDTKSAEMCGDISISREKDTLKGFTLSFNGIFHASDLKSRIEAVKALLSGSPDSSYVINVTLEEISDCNQAEPNEAEAMSGR
jgi:hypothetical protein